MEERANCRVDLVSICDVEYSKRSLLKMNHRFLQICRFAPHFVRYPETMTLVSAGEVTLPGTVKIDGDPVTDSTANDLGGDNNDVCLGDASSESDDVRYLDPGDVVDAEVLRSRDLGATGIGTG